MAELQAVKSYLNKLYKDVSGYDDHGHVNTRAYAKQGINTVYGEITFPGVSKVLQHIPDSFTKNDVFYDLGSGVGKMVTQVFLMTDVKASVGIEGMSDRHKQALPVRRALQHSSPNLFKNRRLSFLCKNFLEHSLSDATVIFMNPVCFSMKLRRDLQLKFNKLPKLHTVISLEPLDKLELPLMEKIYVRCSWDPRFSCYIYRCN